MAPPPLILFVHRTLLFFQPQDEIATAAKLAARSVRRFRFLSVYILRPAALRVQQGRSSSLSGTRQSLTMDVEDAARRADKLRVSYGPSVRLRALAAKFPYADRFRMAFVSTTRMSLVIDDLQSRSETRCGLV
jgi:hypothetical protein